MARLNDTSADAERVLIESYRRMSMVEKWRQMGEIFSTAKSLHAAGVRFRNPDASDEEVHEAWLRQVLGPDLVRTIQESAHGST
jgi:hypothetical protein